MAEAACIISPGIQVRGNLSGAGDLIVHTIALDEVVAGLHVDELVGGDRGVDK